ncbi:MAG: nitrilase-related carbon-nitrogen hydrolase [Bacteroidales bacterium]|nr:nitrilase-related carbon-nitrogen hydrolase [Bacteroidales bacterium]
MKIGLFQQDITWLDIETNYKKIEEQLEKNADLDLLVMPEMCTTGFVTLPKNTSIESSEACVAKLKELASHFATALCGSFAVEESGKYYNRAYFVTPQGEVWQANKRHLFTPGGEGRQYEYGKDRIVAEYMGVRFLLLICYDLRFPVWARYTDDQPYDCLIYMANWPTQRQLAWQTLLPARAIENQAYVLGINRIGNDDLCPYQGGTVAIHPYGHIVAQCQDNLEEICAFEPDIKKMHEFRQKFPSQTDADIFEIKR